MRFLRFQKKPQSIIFWNAAINKCPIKNSKASLRRFQKCKISFFKTMKWSPRSALRFLFFFAGFLAFFGGVAGFFLHPLFFIFSIFVGAMQMIFALTGFCPALFFLKKMNCNVPEKL